MTAIADIRCFDEPLTYFALQIKAPVINTRGAPEIRSQIVDGKTVAIGGTEKRRRLISGRSRDSAVPLERSTDGIGRDLIKRATRAQNTATAAVACGFIEHTPPAAQHRFGCRLIGKAKPWTSVAHIGGPEAA